MTNLTIDLYKYLYTCHKPDPEPTKFLKKGDPSTPLTSPSMASDSRWSAISFRARSKYLLADQG